MQIKIKALKFEMNQAKGISGTYTISVDDESYYRCWYNDTESTFSCFQKTKKFSEAVEACNQHHEKVAFELLEQFVEAI